MGDKKAPSRKSNRSQPISGPRIKKLMHKDEDIGKMTQSTPIAVGIALKLFLESFVKESVRVAQGSDFKFVSVSHMIKAIDAESRFDFLRGGAVADLAKDLENRETRRSIKRRKT